MTTAQKRKNTVMKDALNTAKVKQAKQSLATNQAKVEFKDDRLYKVWITYPNSGLSLKLPKDTKLALEQAHPKKGFKFIGFGLYGREKLKILAFQASEGYVHSGRGTGGFRRIFPYANSRREEFALQFGVELKGYQRFSTTDTDILITPKGFLVRMPETKDLRPQIIMSKRVCRTSTSEEASMASSSLDKSINTAVEEAVKDLKMRRDILKVAEDQTKCLLLTTVGDTTYEFNIPKDEAFNLVVSLIERGFRIS